MDSGVGFAQRFKVKSSLDIVTPPSSLPRLTGWIFSLNETLTEVEFPLFYSSFVSSLSPTTTLGRMKMLVLHA